MIFPTLRNIKYSLMEWLILKIARPRFYAEADERNITIFIAFEN